MGMARPLSALTQRVDDDDDGAACASGASILTVRILAAEEAMHTGKAEQRDLFVYHTRPNFARRMGSL